MQILRMRHALWQSLYINIHDFIHSVYSDRCNRLNECAHDIWKVNGKSGDKDNLVVELIRFVCYLLCHCHLIGLHAGNMLYCWIR